MSEARKTYEQYCTHLKRNVVMEETITSDGKIVVICTNTACECNEEGCKNKLRKIQNN